MYLQSHHTYGLLVVREAWMSDTPPPHRNALPFMGLLEGVPSSQAALIAPRDGSGIPGYSHDPCAGRLLGKTLSGG
jgi:hypothetical protein